MVDRSPPQSASSSCVAWPVCEGVVRVSVRVRFRVSGNVSGRVRVSVSDRMKVRVRVALTQ